MENYQNFFTQLKITTFLKIISHIHSFNAFQMRFKTMHKQHTRARKLCDFVTKAGDKV